MNISIVLADDHELVRSGIRRLLEYNNGFCVIGEAGNGNEAVQLVRALRPDVAVLDISMPLMGGIEAARSIHKQSPNTGIIILSMYYDEGHVIDALRAGALGYVIKASAGSEFFDAVHTVASHRLFLSPQVSAKVLERMHGKNGDTAVLLHELSPREREILQLVVEGHSSAKIGTFLGLSSSTVDTYRSRLMAKLHIDNVPDLVRFAIRHGLLKLD
jgi:DNA-binding NarL/FixJ family response regulator